SEIDEYGRIETPVMLTNTLSVGTVYEGVVRYMVEHVFAPNGNVPWHNPVVGETSDAFLNDIGGLHVRPEHAMQAIRIASGGPVEEGCAAFQSDVESYVETRHVGHGPHRLGRRARQWRLRDRFLHDPPDCRCDARRAPRTGR